MRDLAKLALSMRCGIAVYETLGSAEPVRPPPEPDRFARLFASVRPLSE